MKFNRKFLLAPVLSFISILTYAMEPIEDEDMGEISGQQGLVNIAIKAEGDYGNITWEDTEGEAALKDGEFTFETVDGAIGIGFDKNGKNEDVLKIEVPELALTGSTSGSIGTDGNSIGRISHNIHSGGATLYIKGH